jgi:hypothetical protein
MQLGDLSEKDATMLHHAAGTLLGLNSKYKSGLNLLLYYNRFRIRIEWVERQMVKEDLDVP